MKVEAIYTPLKMERYGDTLTADPPRCMILIQQQGLNCWCDGIYRQMHTLVFALGE